jgi:short-subunit dehydrogenase
MSSYSGEVGLIYRTGYCASKFAVTGFFESLRMETQGQLDITIVCPPTVETNLRKNAIVFHHKPEEQIKSKDAVDVKH